MFCSAQSSVVVSATSLSMRMRPFLQQVQVWRDVENYCWDACRSVVYCPFENCIGIVRSRQLQAAQTSREQVNYGGALAGTEPGDFLGS